MKKVEKRTDTKGKMEEAEMEDFDNRKKGREQNKDGRKQEKLMKKRSRN